MRMVMYIVTVLMGIFIILHYSLGHCLYQEPKNEAYFSNVKHYNVIHQRDIMPSPSYIIVSSILLGIGMGVYISLAQRVQMNWWLTIGTVLLLSLLYLVELTRKITLNDEELILERMLGKTRRIPLNQIDGMYLFSWNKKFLDKNALTTKLVVVTGKKKYPFTLSGIEPRAVMNMMKENFGVTENKMFIAHHKETHPNP